MGVDVTWFHNNPNKAPFGEPKTWQAKFVGLPRHLEVAVNGIRRKAPRLAKEFGRRYSERLLARELAREQFDVVHVHTIHNCYWDHGSLTCIKPETPTVWSFHDCWNFSAESQIYEDLEGNTVRLKPDGENRDRAVTRKRAYFDSRPRAQLVANSQFTANYAKSILNRDVEVIHYGLPLEILSPIDKGSARKALQLPEHDFVVGFIADVRGDKLKGFAVLSRALERIRSDRMHAVAIGEGDAGASQIGTTKIRFYGRVANPALLAILYSAADVFVVPSLAESLGMVGMESIACGTPVIGSEVGGIPDVVRPGRTGWLFKKGDSARLAELLQAVCNDPGLASALFPSCRQIACSEWTTLRQAERYLGVYKRAGAQLNANV
jgi:glycosyltransferase involved in cell wall biosynthesis